MLSVKEIELYELSNKNPIVSDFWAEVKKVNNWKANAYSIIVDRHKYEIMILSKKMFLNYYLAYIPFAPISLNSNNTLDVEQLESAVKIINKNSKIKYLFFRFDLPFEYGDFIINNSNFVISTDSIQPEATVRINLENSIETIKSNYRKRAVRNIKNNKGVIEVKDVELTQKNIDLWFDLYKETALRDGFITRSKDYIDAILFNNSSVGKKLICGYKGNELVGGIVVIYSKNLALYLFGASKKIDKYSPSYSIQDYAIETMHDLNVKSYDFYGIGNDKKSPHLSSLTLFKTSFGGEILTRVSTIDYPIRKLFFKAFKFIEKIRLFIYR